MKIIIAMILIIFSVTSLFTPAQCFAKTYTDSYESSIYDTKNDISLYRHHKDQDMYCILVDDIVVTENDMNEILEASNRDFLIKERMNFLLRVQPNFFSLDTNEVEVFLLLTQQSETAAVYSVSFQTTLNRRTLQIEAFIHVIKALAQTFETTLPAQSDPTTVPVTEEEKVTRPVGSSPSTSKVQVTEETSPSSFVEETETTEETTVETTKKELELTNPSKNEETISSFDEPNSLTNSQNLKDILIEHSYVASFGFSGIYIVILGGSILLDMKALLWYRKKRMENKKKRGEKR